MAKLFTSSPTRVTVLLTCLLLLPAALLYGQQEEQEQQFEDQQLPNVYLDCSGYCFQDYVRTNIPFINFVRDQADAVVHLLITEAGTGSGGTEYTMNFIGRGAYEGRADTLVYSSPQSATQDEERGGLVRHIKIGLSPYIMDTPLLQYADLQVDTPGDDEQQQQQQDDKWNYWVFEADVSGQYDEEETERSYQISGGLNANRTTHDWKIDLDANYDYEEERFEFTDTEFTDGDPTEETSTRTFTSVNRSLDALVVKSLGPHWSAGLSGNVGSSTFSNIDWEYGGSPTLEYNVFPYREFQRRELLVQYQISPTYNQYRDTTRLGKIEEFVVQQSLEVSLDVTETWGSINASIEGSHYLHDATKNRLSFRTNLNFRITRGLEMNLELDYSLISDEITLPPPPEREERLTGVRDVPTSYSFGAEIGLSFTFGSIYNSIVNPRIGGGGGGFF